MPTVPSVSCAAIRAVTTSPETDGTVSTYQGTYTVDNGVIIGFDVLQTG